MSDNYKELFVFNKIKNTYGIILLKNLYSVFVYTDTNLEELWKENEFENITKPIDIPTDVVNTMLQFKKYYDIKTDVEKNMQEIKRNFDYHTVWTFVLDFVKNFKFVEDYSLVSSQMISYGIYDIKFNCSIGTILYDANPKSSEIQIGLATVVPARLKKEYDYVINNYIKKYQNKHISFLRKFDDVKVLDSYLRKNSDGQIVFSQKFEFIAKNVSLKKDDYKKEIERFF